MRTSNSIKNSLIGVIASLVNILASFIAQKLFINFLGIEYLGLNGLFTNILSFLGIAELGIGEAIIFNMYKPIAENDREKIKSLMKFYKRAYLYIIGIILIVGIAIIPFVENFVGETNLNINIKLVYLLFLSQTVSSYILAYKRSILYASQKNYIINIIHIFYIIALNVGQILMLYFTSNYFLYLAVKIVCVILENTIITLYVNKHFAYLNEKNVKELSSGVNKDIFSRIKAMFLHKIGSFVINGTDNILISKMFGVLYVGLYSNYYMITNAVTSLFSQFISASVPSIGNLLVENNEAKTYLTFKRIRFLNFYIATCTGTCILIVIQPFIKFWVGNEYLLSIPVVLAIIFNYYQKMMRKTYDSFMVAAGICIENRFVPIIESILNIIFSIVFAKIFGLVGIFIGTIVSGLTLWLYSYPQFMYKKILKRKYSDYIKETFFYIVLFAMISMISFRISLLINIKNIILKIAVYVVLAVLTSNLLLICIFFKSDNFKYFKELMWKTISNIRKKLSKC